MKERRVILSGGGTGGHLYPSLAVAKKLREMDPALRVMFIGSRRPIEKKIMSHDGTPFVPLPVEGIQGRGLRSVAALALLPFAFLKSMLILLRFKPDLVIGCGGFSAGPVVVAASLCGIPTLLLEQNVYPGLTNRLLRRWARKAVVSFENSLPFFKGKAVFLGNPVREEFSSLSPKPRTGKLSLLIFGGSQGSRVINRAMVGALPLLREAKSMLAIVHQTGKADFDWVRESYKEQGFEEATISPYFFEMASLFASADLVICRAGATTIAELVAAQKASLLIPFALAAEDHQTKNARELERVGGAEVLPEKNLTPARLAERILFYLEHQEKITAMERNLAALRTDRPAEKIARLCFEMMEGKS